MEIRNSTEQDFKRIMEIYVIAREYMKSHGNPNQWGPTKWPPLIHMVLFTVQQEMARKKEQVLSALTGLSQNAVIFVG